MEKSDLTTEQYERLSNAITAIVAEMGPSHTTMDLVAKRLGMSKRTLYEIFGSKDDMMRDIMQSIHQQMNRDIEEIVKSSENVMESMARVIGYYKEHMKRLNANFFRDMDSRYKNLRSEYETSERSDLLHLTQAIRIGIRQDVFRRDVNYPVMLRLLRVQMESLKRMEEFFPPDITLVEAYDTIGTSFMRSIATPKGMEILEKVNEKLKN